MDLNEMPRRLLFASVILSALAWPAVPRGPALAGDWMFRRSYYSHQIGPGERDDWTPSRSAYREPWVGAHPHFAARGGWRINSFIIHNGSSTDVTFFRENWSDVNY